MHLIKSLGSNGKGAIILPHGVLFRGNKEADIRKNLIRRGFIKGIIGLPANLFYGTGIPACILIVDKENAHACTDTFIIDASRGFKKDGNKNRLRAQDIHRNVYQCLMDYWDETMQDDLYMLATDGWIGAARPRGIIESKEKELKETPDLVVRRRKYKMDLVPPVLVVGRCFAAERTTMEALQATRETAARELEEFIEEHRSQEGLLEDVVNDKGKVTKASMTQRLNAIGNEPESKESKALTECLALITAETKAGKAVKETETALDEQTLARYTTLTEAEIKSLVVEYKWFASIQTAIEGEVQHITRQLAGRVRELEERYASPLPELERELEAYSEKVEGYLKKMGCCEANA